MEPFAWTCPYCDRDTTIGDNNYWDCYDVFTEEAKLEPKGRLGYRLYIITCPNPKCERSTLTLELLPTKRADVYKDSPRWVVSKPPLQQWRLIPPSRAKVFPAYIPQPIIDDYREACLIQNLSPKASATLSRRCLQGMIRNFWGIKEPTLKEEIDALKNKVEPETWDAIEAVRGVGNIGAHMEKDINLIIEVEPDEAGELIWLIETLIKDWYINKHEREERLKEVAALGAAKKEAKSRKGGGAGAP